MRRLATAPVFAERYRRTVGWWAGTRLLLLLTRRLPAEDPGVEVFGEQALLTHWLEHTPF